MVQATGARQHKLFPGNIDKEVLNVGERAIVASLRAPTGDFRDFGEIRRWATGVADEIRNLARERTGFTPKKP